MPKCHQGNQVRLVRSPCRPIPRNVPFVNTLGTDGAKDGGNFRDLARGNLGSMGTSMGILRNALGGQSSGASYDDRFYSIPFRIILASIDVLDVHFNT